jgi:membrane peptidoglycan carboxypeptidase
VLGVLMVSAGLAAYAVVARSLPSPDELQARVSQFASTLVYDREGNLLNEVGDPNYGRRTVVPLDQISQYLIDATLATEDPNFYRHPGVDPVGIARAVYYAVKERDLSSGPGGSTITQQLVKLTFLSPERTLSRKVKEAILAAEITRRYPKDTILAVYLNEIYYGNLAYGIEAAAETYFGKHAQDLTLAESAMLAGLPQAPAFYDPYTKLWEADGTPGPVKERQGDVLRLMVENGAISTSQADAAWEAPLRLKPLDQTYDMRYPHFLLYARGEVERVLGPELAAKGGLRIHTTMDPRIQDLTQAEVAAQVAKLGSQGATNGAAVVVRPTTGELLAMVGSADFGNEAISGQINMAIAPRQPGSALKPFTYLATFEMPAAVTEQNPPTPDPNAPVDTDPVSAIEPPGYWTPSTAIMDITTQFPDGANSPYAPTNYDDREHGLVTVRTALANSLNIPAVKALNHVGLDRFTALMARVGVTTLNRPDYGLSLTLGGGDVTLLELTGAYSVLANGGTRVPVGGIACVLDATGQRLWAGNGADDVAACAQATGQAAVTPAPAESVLNPQHVALITSILSDREARRPMFGAVSDLLGLSDRAAAAKTGTSNDYRDAWTIGYTPDLAVGAWVGNADYTPMKKIAGSVGAAPVWHNVMQRSLEGQPVAMFVEPAGIQRLTVCADTGTLPGAACPQTREERFAGGQGPLPAGYDLYQRVRVDRETGQPATEFTPADRVEERVVMVFPPKYRDWALAHGYPVLLAQAPQYTFPPELTLYEPGNNAVVSGLVTISGKARVPEPLVWQLEYGVGSNPIGWGVLNAPTAGEIDGPLGQWDVDAAAARHEINEFTLRLAAYDPTRMDTPVAVSNSVYVTVVVMPEPTATLEATPTMTPTPELATPIPSPTAEPSPTGTPSPSATPQLPTPTPTSPVVGALVAAILTPVEGAQVAGVVEIIGIAEGPNFAGYELLFAPGAQPSGNDWLAVGNPGLQPVTGSTLGVWDTAGLEPGIYTLLLRAYDGDGNTEAALVRVEVVGA